MDDKATMIDRNHLSRMKRNNLWVTDATVLTAQSILVISTTSRELNFYDVSSNVYKFLYRLCGKWGGEREGREGIRNEWVSDDCC